MITDREARRIASEWHGGQGSALLSFATTGMIDDLTTDEVQAEIDILAKGQPDCTPDEAQAYLAELSNLQEYLWDAGHRTPVEWWSRLNF